MTTAILFEERVRMLELALSRAEKRLAKAEKIMRPLAEMRDLFGANERAAVAWRPSGGNRFKAIEVRHLSAAKSWMQEGENG